MAGLALVVSCTQDDSQGAQVDPGTTEDRAPGKDKVRPAARQDDKAYGKDARQETAQFRTILESFNWPLSLSDSLSRSLC